MWSDALKQQSVGLSVRDLADARAVQAIAKHLQEAVHALLAFMQANFTG